jgi:SAM-dependent methyltransferase
MSVPEAKINTSRLLLAQIRGGDYAHAGDTEAIDSVTQRALLFDPSLRDKANLDVGSGFGGTASYLYHDGFKNIQGIDVDQAAVMYAKEKYPLVNFTVGDALSVDQIYPVDHFSFICLFNVIYAIHNKETLLTKLSTIARPGAILAVFDYSQDCSIHDATLRDLAGNPMYPIRIAQFKRDLREAGWEILEITDMTSQYIGWYKNLLKKLSIEPLSLKKAFSPQDLSKARATFSLLLSQLEQGILGGIIVYAKKQDAPRS